MNIYQHFEDEIIAILRNMEAIPADTDMGGITCELPRDPAHGEIATNAAMVLAKRVGILPISLAHFIASELKKHKDIVKVNIAGPGFINIWIKPELWKNCIHDILKAETTDGHGQCDYGKCDIGKGKRVNVEYVSANPTGPLHAAHARGAIVGDSLARLLKKAGFEVVREYYINDAGAQVDTLARSAYARYREALGCGDANIPEGGYPGDYLKETGSAFADMHGEAWLDKPESEWLPVIRTFAIDAMMEGIKADLKKLDIDIDVFTSERALVESGAVDTAINALMDKELIYKGVLEPPKGKPSDDWESREQMLFKSTDFGDDTDRPVQKSDGSWTYFATDIAYHYDKLSRGSAQLIDVVGADHGGYVKRIQGAAEALSGKKGVLDVKLCQLVKLMDKGEVVKMSKRAGTFVTLSDVIDSVGKDILRFIMLTRRNDQAMNFDYASVKEQSRENPVFYVQYAHARAASVRRQAKQISGLDKPDLDKIDDEAEMSLIRQLALWPQMVKDAAKAHEPHRIAFFLQDLAALFHGLWNKGRDKPELRFIIEDDYATTSARLALVDATRLVIRSGLDILGVEPVEEM